MGEVIKKAGIVATAGLVGLVSLNAARRLLPEKREEYRPRNSESN